MSGRERNDEWVGFYEDAGRWPPFLVGPFPRTHVPFQEWTGLGDVAWPIVSRFGDDDYLWYHASVKAAAWKVFDEHVLQMDGVYVLPFWCLCDGRKEEKEGDGKLRHHRHMILVVRKGVDVHAKWKRRVEKVGKLGQVKFLKPILSSEHLRNALYYVSTPKARCDGTICYLPHDNTGSHYWINRPICPHAKVAMAILVEGGLEEYLRELGRNRNPFHWFELVDKRGADLVVPLKHLGIGISGCPAPIKKGMQPWRMAKTTDEGVDEIPRVHLYGDAILLLEENKKLLDLSDDEWYEHQCRLGNCFLEAVHEELFVLGACQKGRVKDMLRVKDRCDADRLEELSVMRKAWDDEFEALTREKEAMENRTREATTREIVEAMANRMRQESEWIKREVVEAMNAERVAMRNQTQEEIANRTREELRRVEAIVQNVMAKMLVRETSKVNIYVAGDY